MTLLVFMAGRRKTKESLTLRMRSRYCFSCLHTLSGTGTLKGLSHEIDFKIVDENGQILALLRAAAGF